MFQEVERTYRTALEEELQWNINFLKVLVIILLVSSGAMLIYMIMHSIILRYPGLYGTIISNSNITEFFMNFFAVAALYVTYPAAIALAIIFIRLIRYFPNKEKGKLLLSAIILLCVLGLSIVFALIRIIYVVSVGFPYFIDGYQRIINASYIVSFFIDYIGILLALVMLGLILKNQKESEGYTGNLAISPIISLSLLVLWLFLVVLYYIILEEISGLHFESKITKTIAVFACLTSAAMIATYAEMLVKLKNINIPQIITTKEKLA